jgi:calcium/calmodulin-dependent protein kinase I
LIKDIIDAFAKKKITSEPCILGISKANSLSNLNMTLSTFESCNQNAFRYDVPPEVLIESIFDKFSTSGSQLTYPEFANFIQSQSWILTFIKSTFRIDSWNNQSNMQLKSPLVQPYSNPGIFSIKYSVKIFFHGKWVPKYIEIRDIYIVIYTEKKAIDEVILAEGCLIKTKEQVLSIIYSTQYDERLKIFFSKSEECEFFGNLIVRIANIRKFKNFYSLEQNIGHGKFSEVYIAKEFATNIEWAVKVIHKRKLDKLEREMIRKEISILTYVNHPGIVKIKEVFNSHKYIFIVMDYIPAGNLLKKIKVEKLQECEIRNIVKDILLVLKYLHSLGIMHRDLKPENIMISDSDQIKVIIIDFGLATYFSYDDILSHCCGTLGYTAPEVFAKSYSYKVDIWSVGIIAYACFATKLPFISHFKQETIELTQTKEVTFDDNTWEQCSENSKKLIIDLLAKDPSQRLDCEQALSHPWFEV